MWSENTNYVMALLVYTLWLPSIISCHIFLSAVTFITLKPGSSTGPVFLGWQYFPPRQQICGPAGRRPGHCPHRPLPLAFLFIFNYKMSDLILSFHLHQDKNSFVFVIFIKNIAEIPNNCWFSKFSKCLWLLVQCRQATGQGAFHLQSGPLAQKIAKPPT